uniref:DUF5710 domain-containing protein n=1 Tax=Macrostomum lignano TaxID=282301 RepID=A0A1I8FM59_9PLAT
AAGAFPVVFEIAKQQDETAASNLREKGERQGISLGRPEPQFAFREFDGPPKAFFCFGWLRSACCCLLAAPAASAGRRRAGEAALIDTLGRLGQGGQFGALLSNYWSRLPLWLVARLKSIQQRASLVAKETAKAVQKKYSTLVRADRRPLGGTFFFPSRRLSLALAAALLEEAAATRDAAASGDNQEEDGFDEKPTASTNLTELAQSRPASVDLSGDGSPLQRLLDKFCGAEFFVAAAEQEAAAISRHKSRSLYGTDWRRAVLSWQRANGCYGAFPNELVARENFNPARYGNYRRKRSEALMGSGGCPLPPDIGGVGRAGRLHTAAGRTSTSALAANW